jgi:hypothetical protein
MPKIDFTEIAFQEKKIELKEECFCGECENCIIYAWEKEQDKEDFNLFMSLD